MLAYGGGGHEAAGTCQIDNERAEAVLAEIVGSDRRRRAPGVPRLTDARASADSCLPAQSGPGPRK